jgi:tetratricopeptide (TPR) repeat protein
MISGEEGVAITHFHDSDGHKDHEKELWERLLRAQGIEKAEILAELGHIAVHQGKWLESLAHGQTALEIYQTTTESFDPEDMAKILMGIAFAHYKASNYTEAAAATHQAYELLEEMNSPRAGVALRNLGVFLQEAKKYAESAEIFRKALKIPQLEDEELTLAKDYYNLGFALTKLEQFNEAIEMLTRGKELASRITAPIVEALCNEQLAFCFASIGEYEAGLEAVKFSIDYALLSGDDSRMFESVRVRGRVNMARKDYESAISDLKAAKSINIDNSCITDWDAIYEIEEEIASILELLGQVEEAEEVRRRIKVVSNSN